jgi:hypothetical protein
MNYSIFLFAFLGSWGAEIVFMSQIYHEQKDFPIRYRKIGFWIIRFLVSIIAGGVALAYNITLPILAIHIGAATPIIFKQFATTLPDIK